MYVSAASAPIVLRCASSSDIKLEAVRRGFAQVKPHRGFDLRDLAVELQDRPDLAFDAQPEGKELTITYANARLEELIRRHGPTPGIDFAIESGAIDGMDIAVVAVRSCAAQKATQLSWGVPFPSGTLEEARRRGFKTTTVGKIIHERDNTIPANDWHSSVMPGMTRERQIRGAVIEALHQIEISF